MTYTQLTTEFARLQAEADEIDRVYAVGLATARDIRLSENRMATVLRKLAMLDDDAIIEEALRRADIDSGPWRDS